MGERSGDNIVICMLDWKQAFDRISHPPDDAGLGKVELTKKIQKSYCKLLHGPFPPSETRQFSVACQISRCRHTSGMPTLPISVFTRHDCSVSRHWRRTLQGPFRMRARPNQLKFSTQMLPVSRNTFGMNLLLHAIEEESTYYGLKLNRDKCHVLAMNGRNCVRFKDGSRMKHVEETVYLAGI